MSDIIVTGTNPVQITVTGALKGPRGDTGPTGPQGAQGTQGIQGETGPADPAPRAVQIDDVTVTNTVFIGKAPIGSLPSAPVWQIAKLDVTSVWIKTWADGNSNYDNVFDDRASLSYS